MSVGDLVCEDRFSDAAVGDGFECGLRVEHTTGWYTEDEKLMKEMDQCVGDEELVSSICSSMCCSLSRLIELIYVTSENLCSVLERRRMHEERSEDENFSVKLGDNRGQFIGRRLGTKNSDQMPVPKHIDKIQFWVTVTSCWRSEFCKMRTLDHSHWGTGNAMRHHSMGLMARMTA